jgi:phosphatidylserine/phosphatidylglycerophosphate/cardiolipin synthase-like enzyme
MNWESKFVSLSSEDLRRYDNRLGFDLVSCQEVGLPVYKVTVDVLTQIRKPIPPIEEFVLKAIDAGLSSEEEVAGFLGLELSTTREAMVNLRLSEDIDLIAPDASQLQMWRLTKKGERTLKEAKIIVPEERTFDINFDGLLRTPRWYDQFEKRLLKPKDLRDEGILEIEPSPKRPPELSDLKIKDIDEIICKILENARDWKPKNKQELDLLALKAIERRQRFFQAATSLVYKAKDGDEIQVAFIVDNVLSNEHEAAFARANGVKKLRIADSLEKSNPHKLAEEVLGTNRLDQSSLERSKELNKEILSTEAILITNQEKIKNAETDEGKNQLKQENEYLREEIKKLNAEKDKLSVQRLEVYDHRPLLERAIRESQERLMIISPWINAYSVDAALLREIENLLRREVKLCIGYGISDEKDQKYSNRKAEQDLQKLAKRYSDNFIFKRLGDTHAKILISDTKFYVMTSFNWLSFKGEPDRTFRDERGTLVSDPQQIDELFDDYLRRLTEGS